MKWIVECLDIEAPHERFMFIEGGTRAAARAKAVLSALDAGWYGGDFVRAANRIRVRVDRGGPDAR